MFSRIRNALGLATLLTVITSVAVFAKGGFSFISITGPNLKDAVRVTDPALTTDFFAFADFFQHKTETPANPGAGYEITRYYVDGGRETAFDRLHYYPDTGFVYYDGIVNGSSEYDSKWYTAKPEIKTVFESALSLTLSNQKESFKPIDPVRSGVSVAQPQSVMPVTVIAGFVIILALAFWLAGNWYFKSQLKRGGVSDQSLENPRHGG